jgi:dTDP-glucose 4,6-dehydratase
MANLSGKVCLVTGAAGFIGSHLVERLVSEGNKVVALVRYNSSSSIGLLEELPDELSSSVKIIHGDIRDATFVKRAIEGVDVVFHLAALIGIPYSYVAPESYIDTNVKGTLNVLQAATENGVKAVVTSTSEVYGTARYVPMDEDHPLNAQSPYSASKIAADQLALSFHASFDSPVVIARPFNTFGPRQSARAVIPSIILQLLRGDGHLKLGDLSPTRDFCFVQDTVSGFLAVAASDSVSGEVVNIGTGNEYAIGDVANLVGDLLGKEVVFEQDEQRMRPSKSDVMRLHADISKAESLAQWSPEFAGRDGFSNALSICIDWFSKRLDSGLYSHDFRL